MNRRLLSFAASLAAGILTLAIPAAHAGGGPVGLYALDVEATLAALPDDQKSSPDSRKMLESMAAHTGMSFEDDILYVLLAPDPQAETFGSCAWALDGTAVVLSDCQSPKPDVPFTFVGEVYYSDDQDMVAVAMPEGGPVMLYSLK